MKKYNLKKEILKKDPMIKRLQNYLKLNRKLILFSMFVFFLLCLFTVGPIFVRAMIEISANRQEAIQQKNFAINNAIVNGDYDTWNSLVTDQNLKKQITRENFSEFADIYLLMQAGKVQEADLIKQQMNLKKTFVAVSARSQAIDSALKNNSYDAWRSLVGDKQPNITQANFTDYSTIYRLLQEGNIKQATILKQRIGLVPVPDYSSSR